MRFPADGPDTAKNSVLLGVGILKFIDHATGNRVRIAAANTSPLSLRTRNRADLTCHQNPIRHGGVFTRYCFADLSQCAGDHQIADRNGSASS